MKHLHKVGEKEIMSLYEYLIPQPLEETDDGTISELDQYKTDETIELTDDIDEAVFEQKWDEMLNGLHDDEETLTFSEE